MDSVGKCMNEQLDTGLRIECNIILDLNFGLRMEVLSSMLQFYG